ncbi:MAG: mechanosensitive ion channel family protein [Pirellulaceae bacterium]
MRFPAVVACLLFATSASVPVCAQESVESVIADTSSPRATLQSFLEAMNEVQSQMKTVRYFDRRNSRQMAAVNRALDCLNVSEMPEFVRNAAAAEAAVCLKEVLDRSKLPPLSEIPDLEAITADGSELKRWHIPGTRISIAQVEDGPRKYEFLFSPGTIERVFSYYREIESLPYRTTGPATSPGLYKWFDTAPGIPFVAGIVDRLPDAFRNRAMGMALWKWVGLIIAIGAAIGLMMALYRVQQLLAQRWQEAAIWRYCMTVVLPILAMLVPQGFKHVASYHLTLRGNALLITSFLSDLFTLLAGVVVIFAVGNRVAQIIVRTQFAAQKPLNAQLTQIVSKVTCIVLAVILVLEGGQYLGIPITTLLASAGVGGLAVALAAQNALKGLIGTVMLMTDKPFRLGDRIVVKDFDGIVESIGLRSTKVRLLIGHVVTIPNDQLADNNIENIGSRPHIRRKSNILVPLDTRREKLEKAVELVRNVLEQSGHMDPEKPPRVYFNEFNEHSYNIRVYYWFIPADFWEYLEFNEQVNLEICRVFEEHGIQFSLPERIVRTDLQGGETSVDQRDEAGL